MPHVTNMVMSSVEGHLPSEQAITFLQTYQQQLAERPPRIIEAYVVHSMEDATLWRIVALWPSREALDEYRASVDVTGGVLLFHTVCVEPTVAIFEVLGEWTSTQRRVSRTSWSPPGGSCQVRYAPSSRPGTRIHSLACGKYAPYRPSMR